jgi:hypothetical protein
LFRGANRISARFREFQDFKNTSIDEFDSFVTEGPYVFLGEGNVVVIEVEVELSR